MVTNVQRQIEYWRTGSIEDWDVGVNLVEQGKTRHGLFLIHLAMEKALKTHVCRTTLDLAPRIHALNRLAEMTDLKMTDDMKDVLGELMRYNIACRHPETLDDPLSRDEAKVRTETAERVYKWLLQQL